MVAGHIVSSGSTIDPYFKLTFFFLLFTQAKTPNLGTSATYI